MPPEIFIFHHPDNHCPTQENYYKNRLALPVTRPPEPLSGQDLVKLAERQNPYSYLFCHGCGDTYQPKEIILNPSEKLICEITKFVTNNGPMPASTIKNS